VLRALDDLNLRRLGAVAEVTVAQLRAVIGPAAAPLHRCANGLDDRAVVPAAHRPSVAFVQSLGSGMIEPQRIAGLCYGMLETLCGRLRASGQACSLLRVTATYADYREAVSTVRPVEPSQWEYSFASGIEAAVAGAAARRVRIRCVALEGHTTPVRPSQLSLPLGDHSSEHMQAAAANRRRHISGERTRELLSALGAIRLRFGDPAITWGGVPRLPVPA
jgi:hypothetical protein